MYWLAALLIPFFQIVAIDPHSFNREHSVFLPLLYQYLVGGALFSFAIIFAIKVNALSLKNRHDRRTFLVLILGFFAYLFLHTAWILLVVL